MKADVLFRDVRVRTAAILVSSLAIFACIAYGVRQFGIMDSQSISARLSAKSTQNIINVAVQSLDALEANLDATEASLNALRDSLITFGAVASQDQLFDGLHSTSMRSLKQFDWQTTLVSTVRTSLRNYRSTLLRMDVFGQTVGYPNIALWITSGFSSALSYAYFLALQAGPMIATGLLASAVGTIYWCCTRPCRCCGQRQPRPTGYSLSERCVPATLTVLLGLVAGLMFMIGFAGSAYFTTGFNTLTYLPNTALSVISGKITNMTTVINSLGTGISGVTNSAIVVVNSISGLLPQIRQMALTLGNSTQNVATLASQLVDVANNMTFVRDSVAALTSYGIPNLPSSSQLPSIPDSTISQINSASAAAQSAGGTVVTTVNQLGTTITSAQTLLSTTLNQTAATVINLLRGITTSLSSVSSSFDGILSTINPITGMVRSYQVYRDYAMWGFLGIPCLLWFLGIWGALCQCCKCWAQWMNCCMSFWSCAMFWWMFFFAGLWFAFGIAIGDICQLYVTDASVNLPSFIYNLTSCPADGNLLTIFLGMTSINIDLSSLISISSFSNVLNTTQINESMQPVYDALSTNFTALLTGIDVPALASTLSGISGNLTVPLLGGPTAPRAQSALDTINNVTVSEQNIRFVFANVSLLNPNSFSQPQRANLTANQAIAVSFYTLSQIVTGARTNMTLSANKLTPIPNFMQTCDNTASSVRTTIQTSLAQATGSVTTLINNASAILSLLTPLESNFVDLFNLFGCSFIADIWTPATTAICSNMGGGFDVMWFAFLCMGILLLPQCVLGVLGATRYGVPETHEGGDAGGDSGEPDGYGGQGEGVPMKPLNLRQSTQAQEVKTENYGPQTYQPQTFAAHAQVPVSYVPYGVPNTPQQAAAAAASAPAVGQPQFYPPSPQVPPTQHRDYYG